MRVRRVIRAAPYWRRVLADLMDLALLTATALALRPLGAFNPKLPPQRFDWIDYSAELLANHLGAFKGSLGLALAMGLLYALIFRQLLGRTPGEWALNLQLVDRDGLSAGPLQTIIHALGTPIGLALLMVGYTWPIISRDRQGLAEGLSRTLLIHGPPQIDRPRSRAAPSML